MIGKILAICKKAGLDNVNIILRLERKHDIEIAQTCGYKGEFMYYFVPSKQTQETGKVFEDCISKAKWCANRKIYDICMHPDHCTDELIEALHGLNMRICLFSLVKTERVIDFIRRGVDLIGNHYYDINYLYRLCGTNSLQTGRQSRFNGKMR